VIINAEVITNDAADWASFTQDSRPTVSSSSSQVVGTTVATNITFQPSHTFGGTSTSTVLASGGPISSIGTLSGTGSSAGRPSQSSTPAPMRPPNSLGPANTSARRSLSENFAAADFSLVETPTRSMTRVKASRKRSFVDPATTNLYSELKVIKNIYICRGPNFQILFQKYILIFFLIYRFQDKP
jgi:hypothetical protein